MDQLNNKTHENWYSMNITEFVHLHDCIQIIPKHRTPNLHTLLCT